MSLKNSSEPATCRFVAWCFNHYATARTCALLGAHHIFRVSRVRVNLLHVSASRCHPQGVFRIEIIHVKHFSNLRLYSFDLKDYPEDEASVPKHVEINICHKLYFIQCFCCLVYLTTHVIKLHEHAIFVQYMCKECTDISSSPALFWVFVPRSK